jgi:hypothetical protein
MTRLDQFNNKAKAMSYIRKVYNASYLEDDLQPTENWLVDEFEMKHLTEYERKLIRTECQK